MIITGKYTSATIFADNLETSAKEFIQTLCDHPAMSGTSILEMPDVHAGRFCNVGTVYKIGTHVNPDHVGTDIGCTISMHKLSSMVAPSFFALLEHKIREAIPTGTELCKKTSFNEKDFLHFLDLQYKRARSSAPDLINEITRIDARFISSFCRRIRLSERIFYQSIGTLGGGNHFIEYGEYGENEETSEGWLSIHCGSRNFGVKVANHWHNIAQIPQSVQYTNYLWGKSLNGYLSDMVIAQAYALYNHIVIKSRIFAILGKLCKVKCVESIFTPHNYISLDGAHPILRKGAINASKGRKICIPFNMRDGIAICLGKGNVQWLCSAPHGAGRRMSRNQARKQIDLTEFERTMTGIFSTSICKETLDESPQAYKPTEDILTQITPSVEVLSIIKPKLNIKNTYK